MKKMIFVILTILTITLFTSCSPSRTTVKKEQSQSKSAVTGVLESADKTSSVRYAAIDSLGREVILNEKPASIIIAGKATLIAADALSLFQDYRSSISAIGITNQGLGDFFSYLLPEIPATERLPHTVSAEEIAGLQPDLVIIKDRNYNSLGITLENIGFTVFSVYLEEADDYLREIHELGKLLDQENRADEINQAYATRLSHIRDNVSNLNTTQKEDVLLLYTTISDGITSFQVPPESWIQTYLVKEAGANPAWAGIVGSENWQKVSFEQISQWDPDRIYIISYKIPSNVFFEEIKFSPLWQELTAFKNNQIKSFPADYHNWAQPDTRWILGLQWLAWDLHQEIFSTTDMEQEIVDFYNEFYDINEIAIIYDILTRYRKSLITIE